MSRRIVIEFLRSMRRPTIHAISIAGTRFGPDAGPWEVLGHTITTWEEIIDAIKESDDYDPDKTPPIFPQVQMTVQNRTNPKGDP